MARNVPVLNFSQSVSSSGNSDPFSVDGAASLHLAAKVSSFSGSGSVVFGFELQMVDGSWLAVNNAYQGTSFAGDGDQFLSPVSSAIGPYGQAARVAWVVPAGVSFNLNLSAWIRI